MPTIVEAIGGSGPLWFPDLAEELAARLDARSGKPPASRYRTPCRLDGGEHGAARDDYIAIGEWIALLADLAVTAPPLTIEPARWRDGDKACLESALRLLDRIDGLTATLAQLVRVIYRLEAEPAYDISHSDPSLPYSIFVSIPPTGPAATVRLAESILHEAMHLQLSMIEGEARLVADGASHAWSPWQGRERPAQGLLHGLYVFAVIFEALDSFEDAPTIAAPNSETAPCDEQALCDHIGRRRRQIAEEVRSLPDFAASLEPIGERLRRRCLETVLVRV